jgi:hypothetical protein
MEMFEMFENVQKCSEMFRKGLEEVQKVRIIHI